MTTPRSDRGRTTRVLVVESDDVIREAATIGLTRLGFEVAAVADGRHALARFDADPPDVVFTDVRLPGLDGVSLTRAIRERGDVPVLMLFMGNDESGVVEGLDGGADACLTEPFTTDVLAARLRALLRRATPAR
ncbi:response regulator transcription factor [Streptomyces sp. NPDC002851]